MSVYESIFFDQDWMQARYHGWHMVYDEQGARVLRRRYGPINRWLVLASELADEKVARVIDNACKKGLLNEIVLHDFSNSDSDSRIIGARRYVRMSERERLLNKATLVIDLQENEVSIFGKMSVGRRRECRNAIKSGISVEIYDKYVPELMDIFFARYRKLAERHGLANIDKRVLQDMFSGSNLLLVVATQENVLHGMILAYLTKTKSYYSHGVSSEVEGDRSSPLLHWELIKHLKSTGRSWYDLGGVAEIDDKNGIYVFKKSLGGELVMLGAEYVHRSWPIQWAWTVRRTFNAFRAKTASFK